MIVCQKILKFAVKFVFFLKSVKFMFCFVRMREIKSGCARKMVKIRTKISVVPLQYLIY